MEVRVSSIDEPAVAALVLVHLRAMQEVSPPESNHALSVDALADPAITLWGAWDDGELLGCGALKVLEPGHGEIKTMHTAARHRGKGVARAILTAVIAEARSRNFAKLSLETGSDENFIAAQTLYQQFGFEYCGPFGPYEDDPNSAFMSKTL